MRVKASQKGVSQIDCDAINQRLAHRIPARDILGILQCACVVVVVNALNVDVQIDSPGIDKSGRLRKDKVDTFPSLRQFANVDWVDPLVGFKGDPVFFDIILIFQETGYLW